MVTSKDLQLVHALHQANTLIEAADSLHITQSALSHQIKALEHRLSIEIIERPSKPIRLTQVGERMLSTSIEVLPRMERLDEDIRAIIKGDSGRLRIGIECHACYQWLMPTLNEYRNHWPDVELDISGGDRFDTMQELVDNNVEVAITADPQPLPNIEYLPLFDYECLVTIPKKHRLADQTVVQAKDFAQETLISYPVPRNKMDIFRLFLTPAGVEPMAIRVTELTVMSIQLVASGRGLFALPSWAAKEYTDPGYVLARRLGDDGVFSTLYAAVQRRNLEREYIRDFIYAAKDISLATLSHITETQSS